jgi:hypothetical protein
MAAEKKKQLNVWVPPRFKADFEEHCERVGRSQADVVQEALTQHMEASTGKRVVVELADNIRERVKHHEVESGVSPVWLTNAAVTQFLDFETDQQDCRRFIVELSPDAARALRAFRAERSLPDKSQLVHDALDEKIRRAYAYDPEGRARFEALLQVEASNDAN